VATTAYNLGNVLQMQGKQLDEARAHYERAQAIWEAVLDAGHPDLAQVLSATGSLEKRAGNLGAARDSYERALEVFTRLHAVDPQAVTHSNLGNVELAAGNPAAAEKRFRTALDLLRSEHGDAHFRVGRAQLKLCSALRALERLDEARAACHSALATFERVYSEPHSDTGHARLRLAEVEQEAGRTQTALTLAEGAVELLETIDASDADVADAKLVLASLVEDEARAEALLSELRPLVDGARDPALVERLRELEAERR
jgi:tetratricopeptide (TPR) repeat protein